MRVKLSSMFDTITVFGKDVLVREFKGKPYVAAKQLVEALCLSWPTQAVAMRRRFQTVRCLHFKGANGKRKWMLGIPAANVNEWAISVMDRHISDGADLLTAFIDMLEDEAFEASAELVIQSRTSRLGEKYAHLPVISAELKLINNETRRYGTRLNSLIAVLGYSHIAEASKRELDRLMSDHKAKGSFLPLA